MRALLVLFFVALALCQEATDYERQLKAKENEYMKVLERVEKYAAPPAPAAAPAVGGDSEVAALRAELAEMKRLRALDNAKLEALKLKTEIEALRAQGPRVSVSQSQTVNVNVQGQNNQRELDLLAQQLRDVQSNHAREMAELRASLARDLQVPEEPVPGPYLSMGDHVTGNSRTDTWERWIEGKAKVPTFHEYAAENRSPHRLTYQEDAMALNPTITLDSPINDVTQNLYAQAKSLFSRHDNPSEKVEVFLASANLLVWSQQYTDVIYVMTQKDLAGPIIVKQLAQVEKRPGKYERTMLLLDDKPFTIETRASKEMQARIDAINVGG